MPEPPSVLVAIGQGETLKLPKQDYKNIFTEYNVNHIAPATDADFYNRVVKAPATVNNLNLTSTALWGHGINILQRTPYKK